MKRHRNPAKIRQTCRQKRRYATAEAATQRAGERGDFHQYAYRCPACNFYHLTSGSAHPVGEPEKP